MIPKTFTVARGEAGKSLADWLRQRLGLPIPQVRQYLDNRQIRVDGKPCQDAGRRLRPGARIDVFHRRAAGGGGKTEQQKQGLGDVLDQMPVKPTLGHVDDAIVVVNKPAGLTTMRHAEDIREQGKRAKRYLPPTLADFVPVLLARKGQKPLAVRAVHRLDKETSGLVVFARTVEAERHLGGQLRAHAMQRLYQAIVRGIAAPCRIESQLVEDRGDGRRGSGTGENSQKAVTHILRVEELGRYSLVECRLETGRTHQVRIHLGENGTPLCGEKIYDRPINGRPFPDGSGAARVMLHAAELGLVHPVSGKTMLWKAPLPRDMEKLLLKLRGESTNRSFDS